MIISGVAALALVGVLWLLFAPAQIGGSVDYVIIRGVSMEPRLHSGDLAVLHREKTYAIGDVVGYHSGRLHELVLHRIVAKNGNRFLFKGDRNGFVDSSFPAQSDLVGRLWFDIPQGGVPVRWLHVPTHAGLLGGVVALLSLGGGGAAGARRRQRRDVSERLARSPRGQLPGFGPDIWLIATPAIAVLLFALLAVAAFTHARTRIVSDTAAYLQAGSYSYSAVAPMSSVYPDGVVRSSDPIYSNLVRQLRVGIHYRFSSTLPHAVDGKLSLRADLRNVDGWRSPLATSSTRPFNGDTAAATLTLNTKRLYDRVRAFAHDTGITSNSFSLELVPRVTLHGNVAGRAISRPAALAPLSFTVNAQSLAIAQQASHPLATEQPGSVQLRVPAPLTLLRLRIGVDRAKQIGVVGAGLALLVGFAALFVASKRRRAGELTRILRRYGEWIVPVQSPLAGPKVVDVSSMESLVRLAEHYERAMLHEEERQAHSFAFEEDGTVFRYRLQAAPVARPMAHIPVSALSRRR
jgi:signal peptidase I